MGALQIFKRVLFVANHQVGYCPRNLLAKTLVLVAAAGSLLVMIRGAWITEDAYIMFRIIDNFLRGYGLTWNIGERVQVFTCPLWTFLLVPWVGLTSEYYYTTTIVSLAISLGAVLVLARSAPSAMAGAFGIAVVTFSKGFMDYSTSGLENPLAHLLLAIYCLVYFRVEQRPQPRVLLGLSLLASLIVLNRMDHGVLVVPSLLWIYARAEKRAGLVALLLGMTPFLAWEAFSLIYYGSPVPNTAYAKLNLGIPAVELMRQGLYYYQNAWANDPVTLIVVVGGVAAALCSRSAAQGVLALGTVAYLAYIVKVGGDYMSVRLLTAPLLVAVVLLLRFRWVQVWQGAVPATVVLFIVCLLSPHPSLLSGPSFGTYDYYQEVDDHGIADERGYYYPHLGLFGRGRTQESPPPPPGLQRPSKEAWWRQIERERRATRYQQPTTCLVMTNVGMPVFMLGERTHVIDLAALADPLLARLPCIPNPRVGHYLRHLPAGYTGTVMTGQNRFEDRKLGLFYDKLHLIVSGPIWNRKRFQAIWQLNTLQLNHLIDVERYRQAGANDITAGGVRLGKGWYQCETGWCQCEGHEGTHWRWLNTDGVIFTGPCEARQAPALVLEASPGPGMAGQPCIIELVDDEGVSLASTTLASRQLVTLMLPVDFPEGTPVTVKVQGGGATIPSDPRVLNLMVTKCGWQAKSERTIRSASRESIKSPR